MMAAGLALQIKMKPKEATPSPAGAQPAGA
jgi:hypothetical protein